MGKILIVCSSVDKTPEGNATGCWPDNAMAPYLDFTAKGHEVTFVSIKGGKVPLDAQGIEGPYATPKVKQFLDDAAAAALLENTDALDTVASLAAYDAIWLPGGIANYFDFVGCAKLQALLREAADSGKVIAAVCHGQVAFDGFNAQGGEPFVTGKKVTGFSDEEQDQATQGGMTPNGVPFKVEAKLRELGADVSVGEAWKPFAVADGKLVTGQNGFSSELAVEKVLAAMA